MKVAFGHLRYAPSVFWGMSLREWQATLRGYTQKEYGNVTKPMSRNRLQSMMKRYPDARPTN